MVCRISVESENVDADSSELRVWMARIGEVSSASLLSSAVKNLIDGEGRAFVTYKPIHLQSSSGMGGSLVGVLCKCMYI
jgi:hypothetical protein